MKKMTGKSLNITDENIKVIAEHFPESMEEGKIKFDVLKELLGEFIDESNERYQFTWNGKGQALKISQIPSIGTLLPCKEKSKNWDTTENLYIEGDNLEVLKLLQKSYYKKVKMIYIDPPYNTGTDRIYKDSFENSINNYKNQTKQKNKANPETNGRYHTDWLNMMYSRLRVAKNLLTEDGAIFISIDKDEEANLKKICDEIFGENNYVDTIVWNKKDSAKGVPPKNMLVNVHEYILVYSKNESFKFLGEKRNIEKDGFKNPDNDPRGPWRESNIKSTIKSKNEAFTIVDPNTGKEYTNTWAFSKESLEKMIEEKRILWKESLPKQKEYFYEMTNNAKALKSTFGVFDAQSTTVFLKQLLPEIQFDNPKPVNLMKYLLSVSLGENDIIMDFFSGSATTAQAVMELNVEDRGKRKYVLVQLPEIINSNKEDIDNKFNTICDVGEERIRRVGDKIKKETNATIDYGFKVFKLDSSNLKIWNGEFNTEEEANNYFLEHLSPLVDGRTNEDLLYELLLKEGMLLTSSIEKIKVGDKTIYSIGMGYLIICLEDKVDMDIVDEIGKRKPETIIFKDSGFADENAKINTIQELKKYGIAEEVIKSI